MPLELHQQPAFKAVIPPFLKAFAAIYLKKAPEAKGAEEKKAALQQLFLQKIGEKFPRQEQRQQQLKAFICLLMKELGAKQPLWALEESLSTNNLSQQAVEIALYYYAATELQKAMANSYNLTTLIGCKGVLLSAGLVHGNLLILEHYLTTAAEIEETLVDKESREPFAAFYARWLMKVELLYPIDTTDSAFAHFCVGWLAYRLILNAQKQAMAGDNSVNAAQIDYNSYCHYMKVFYQRAKKIESILHTDPTADNFYCLGKNLADNYPILESKSLQGVRDLLFAQYQKFFPDELPDTLYQILNPQETTKRKTVARK